MRRLLIALTAALGSAGFGLLPASAAPVHTPKTVQIVGTQTFSPDEFFSITFRFTPRRIAVHGRPVRPLWRFQFLAKHLSGLEEPFQNRVALHVG
jgi:hypothetical protein